jgi:hypothetical protein
VNGEHFARRAVFKIVGQRHKLKLKKNDGHLGLRNRGLNLFTVAAVFILAAMLFAVSTARAVTFTSSLDRDTIALGESATLSLTFDGGSPKNVPLPPDIPGLEISYVGPSSQFSFINGQTSSTITHRFTLTPKQTGEFTIPALDANVDGQQLRSEPVKLTVAAAIAPPAAAINSGSQIAFMKLSLPKKEIYAGEVVTAEMDVYLRDDVQNFSNPQLTGTPASGFTVGKVTPGSARRAQVGNRVYTIFPIFVALTAVQSGALSVGPFTLNAILLLPSNQQNQNPFFFSNVEQKPVTLATEKIDVESLPLPAENAPANFNGAVGSYTMTVTAGPTNVAVGDPITIRAQISGRGALDAVTLPDQSAWSDFKVFPPTSKVEASGQLGIEGTKTFEEIVAPQNTDVRELPPFSFSFFDPDQKTYRTLTQPAVQLAVHSAGATPAPVIAGTKPTVAATPPQQQDILPIRENFGARAQAGPPLVTRPAFLALQSLPVLAFLAAFVWRKRADGLANNPRLRRQRSVAQLVNGGLGDLNKFAAENKSNEFFAMLFRLLQEQLGERLDCPATSITEADVDKRLIYIGATSATLESLRELFQLCNQARYAPIQTRQELTAVASKFKKVVGELQSLKT